MRWRLVGRERAGLRVEDCDGLLCSWTSGGVLFAMTKS